jgi:integrase
MTFCFIAPQFGVAGNRIPASKMELSATFKNIKGELLEYGFSRLKNGIEESTIKPEISNLKKLSKFGNLLNPEEIKTVIATSKCKNSYKQLMCLHYNNYLIFKGIQWKIPIYKKEETLPFIPLETEIDQLTAACGKRLATILQILKETGVRIGEALFLKWKDIDFQRKLATITPEKGSNPRILPISNKLIAMLNSLPKTKETIFPQCKHSLRTRFSKQRKTASIKLQNPRIRQITFHTLRHFKGTTEYHKTKDILHVKYILGHKDIKSTMVYINLEQAIFQTETDEWITKVAHNETEELQLIEANFQLVRAINETTAIYKKRK